MDNIKYRDWFPTGLDGYERKSKWDKGGGRVNLPIGRIPNENFVFSFISDI